MSAAAGDVASTTGTEAADAGSSVALTEAEEDEAFAEPTGGGDSGRGGKFVLTKVPSVKGIGIANEDDGDDDDDEKERERDEEYAPPMHLHVLRVPARLAGAKTPLGGRSRSSSRSRPGSQRNSPSPSPRPQRTVVRGGELIVGGIAISPSQSVDSSLEALEGDDGAGDDDDDDGGGARSLEGGDSSCSSLDPDLLLDKLGMRDLDPHVTKEELQEMLRKHISAKGGLPTLNERMSDVTMDDSRAFVDLRYERKSASSKDEVDGGCPGSPDQAVATAKSKRDLLREGGLSTSAILGSASYLLNTLDEGEEEGDDENVVLEVPDGFDPIAGGRKKPSLKPNISTMAVCAEGEVPGDDEDEGAGVEVDVPTSVMEELRGRRGGGG